MTFHALRVRAGQVHLVDSNNDGHLGGFGVVNRLHGLRHDPVIRRHYQNGDVGNLGAPGPNGGKRGVARRIEEGDWLALGLNLIRADVLGYATDFTVGDAGVLDNVQQRGLPMVHVAKHSNHRRARGQIGCVFAFTVGSGFPCGGRGLAGQGRPNAQWSGD